MSLILSGSDGLSDVDGSASTPAIRGTDANTGIFFPAADTIAFAEGGTESMRLDSNGNVGIGTSSPAGKLHVAGQTRIQDSANAANYILIGSGANAPRGGNSVMAQTGSMVMGTEAATPLLFVVNAAERARITSDGQVFVNRTARQTGSYDVQGAVYCDGIASNYGLCSHSGRDGAYQTNAVNFQWTGSATRLWIDAADQGSITVSSDYRVKKDIQTQSELALNRIAQIRPVTYTYADYEPFSWKADGIAREGFIAHELAEVIPSAVEGEKDEPNKVQSLKLDALCSVMVKAIQELKVELDEAKARIAVLEAK